MPRPSPGSARGSDGGTVPGVRLRAGSAQPGSWSARQLALEAPLSYAALGSECARRMSTQIPSAASATNALTGASTTASKRPTSRPNASEAASHQNQKPRSSGSNSPRTSGRSGRGARTASAASTRLRSRGVRRASAARSFLSNRMNATSLRCRRAERLDRAGATGDRRPGRRPRRSRLACAADEVPGLERTVPLGRTPVAVPPRAVRARARAPGVDVELTSMGEWLPVAPNQKSLSVFI
jgi:hypothetical protein